MGFLHATQFVSSSVAASRSTSLACAPSVRPLSTLAGVSVLLAESKVGTATAESAFTASGIATAAASSCPVGGGCCGASEGPSGGAVS